MSRLASSRLSIAMGPRAGGRGEGGEGEGERREGGEMRQVFFSSMFFFLCIDSV